jgi:hypothetical protein
VRIGKEVQILLLHGRWEVMIAFCFANGVINFGESVPDGALEIVRHKSGKALKAVVEVKARHAYDGRLLVPGVPEAPNQKAGIEALHRWMDWAFPKWRREGARTAHATKLTEAARAHRARLQRTRPAAHAAATGGR